jgi:ankyrin repeat protein
MAAAGIGTTTVDTRGKYKTQKEAIDTIQLLAAAGANINAGDERGDTALHGAASWGWNDVVRSLETLHADLNAKDARGMTPVDAAMGRALVHSRGTPDVHEDTANLLKQLIASQLTTSTSGPKPENATP